VTDEWLQEGKILVGSENRTAFVKLDFNNDVSFLTGFDCDQCQVKTYDSKKSKTMNPPNNLNTSLGYVRTQYSDEVMT
jgi:hypothetical protein